MGIYDVTGFIYNAALFDVSVPKDATCIIMARTSDRTRVALNQVHNVINDLKHSASNYTTPAVLLHNADLYITCDLDLTSANTVLDHEGINTKQMTANQLAAAIGYDTAVYNSGVSDKNLTALLKNTIAPRVATKLLQIIMHAGLLDAAMHAPTDGGALGRISYPDKYMQQYTIGPHVQFAVYDTTRQQYDQSIEPPTYGLTRYQQLKYACDTEHNKIHGLPPPSPPVADRPEPKKKVRFNTKVTVIKDDIKRPTPHKVVQNLAHVAGMSTPQQHSKPNENIHVSSPSNMEDTVPQDAQRRPRKQVFIDMQVHEVSTNTPHTISTLVDNGSEISVIAPRKMQELNIPLCTLQPGDASKIKLADGTSAVDVQGVLHLWIQIGNAKLKHKFLVADVEPDAIIGSDFTGRHGTDIRYSTMTLRVLGNKKHHVPLYERKNNDQSMLSCTQPIQLTTNKPTVSLEAQPHRLALAIAMKISLCRRTQRW